MSALRLSGLLAAGLLGTRALAQTCNSYGIDFQNGGSYFQNISSTANFTFVSIFEGCANDTANNILVDPSGDEYQCTDTNLQPDDSTQLSSCPLEKDELYSGDWSVLIISNNGNDTPIAYERDFYLTVGVPVSITTTPTLTISSTVTPVSTITVVSTYTSTIVLNATTTTLPSVTRSPTTTVTPAKVTSTKTKTVATVKKTHYVITPVLVYKTLTATCMIPAVQSTPDPICSITPTLVSAAALSTDSADASKAKFRRMFDRAVPLDRAQRVAERKARREANGQLKKRAPDSATTTFTDTNTSDWPTVTQNVTAAATTISDTVVSTADVTSTPSPVTVRSGKTTLAVVTVTAATPTKSVTKYSVYTTTVATKTSTTTITIKQTYTPWQSAMVCTAKGGRMS